MRQITQLLLQDRDNNLLAFIDPQELENCVIEQEINGIDTLNIAVRIDNYISQYIKKSNRVMMFDHKRNEWLEYVINGLEYDNSNLIANCESSLYDTYNSYIKFIDITGNLPSTGLQKILDTAQPKSNWYCGISDIVGTFNMQRTDYTLFEVLHDWVFKVSGEIKTRVTLHNDKIVRYFDILTSIGADNGRVLYDDRDLEQVNIEVPTSTIFTSAYGKGKSITPEGKEDSEPTTFKNVEWTTAKGDPVNKPLGQEYVSLPDAYKTKFGYKDVNGILQHPTTVVKEEGVEVPEELLQRTYDFLLDNVQDKTNYKLSAVDLSVLGLSTIEISLGDIIGAQIVNMGFLYIQSKVLKYKLDIIDQRNNDFELANLANSLTDNIISNDRRVEELEDAVQNIKAKPFLTTVLNKWNEEINKDAGYLFVANPQDGLIAYNASSKQASTKATQLKGGSLRISNTKTSGEFNWTTVLTGDGIIASKIYTGIIQGALFDLDLDSGIIRMGKRNASGIIDDPWLLFTGDTFIFKPLANYSDTATTNASIKASADGVTANFNKTLTNYSNTTEMNSAINTQAQALINQFNTTLGGYPTKVEMTGAINASASGITLDFNAKLTGYTTSTQLDTALTNKGNEINTATDNKLKKYSTTVEMSTAIGVSADGVTANFNKTLTSYPVKTEVTKQINDKGTEVITTVDTKLKDYPTTTVMTGAISASAEGLTTNFNKTLTSYPTQTQVTTQVNNKGSEVTTATDNKLKNYATTTAMNTAISVSASGITTTLNQTLTSYPTKTEVTTQVNDKGTEISTATDTKLADYPTKTVMNTAIGVSADGIKTTFDKTLTSYPTKVQVTKEVNDKGVEVITTTNTKLLDYPTTTVMNGAINASAEGIKTSFNKTLTSYPTKTEVTKEVTDKGTEINTQTDTKLVNYPTKTEMSTAIEVSANGITANFNKTLTTYETISDVDKKLLAHPTTTAMTTAINNKGTEINNATDTKLSSYPTTIAMNAAIEVSASGITTNFNKTLTTYPTKTEVTTQVTNKGNEINSATDTKLTNYPTTNAMGTAINNKGAEINTATDNKLKSYPTTLVMNAAIEVSASGITTKFDKTLTSYPTATEVTKQVTDKGTEINTATDTKIANKGTEINTATDNKLKNYPTTTVMTSAIETSASGITASFNQTLTSYPTQTQVTTQVNNKGTEVSNATDTKIANKGTEINNATDTKLQSYPTTTVMNAAINTSASGITATFDKKLDTYETITGVDGKLSSYPTTTVMNSAINVSAAGMSATISSQLNNGTGKIQTANFVMDSTGFTVKNGKINIQNNAGKNVMSSDASGNLTYSGIMEQRTNGNLTIKIRNNVIELYAPQYENNMVGFLSSYDKPQGEQQGLMLAHDAGDVLTLARKQGNGWYGQIGMNDSNIWIGDPIDINKKCVINGVLSVNNECHINNVCYHNGNTWFNYELWSSNIRGKGGLQFTLYSNEFIVCRQQANSSIMIPIWAAAFNQGCKEDQKRGIKPFTRTPYNILEDTDFYEFYTKSDLHTATKRNMQTNGVTPQVKSYSPVIGANYRTAKELTAVDVETGEPEGINIASIASIAAAHTKQLKVDTDKQATAFKAEIEHLKGIVDSLTMEITNIKKLLV